VTITLLIPDSTGSFQRLPERQRFHFRYRYYRCHHHHWIRLGHAQRHHLRDRYHHYRQLGLFGRFVRFFGCRCVVVLRQPSFDVSRLAGL
jgi:hypothetical protein